MASPLFSPTAQLRLNGTWTNITSDVRQADGIQITRGRADEASSVDPSSCALTLDNRSGDYSSRNPVGAHFGVLGRNTPLRVLGPASEPNHVLLSGGVNSSNSASGPACFAATNTVGPFTSGGDLDLRIEVEPLSWRPSTDQGLATEHWTEGTGTLAWKLRLLTTGHLMFTWSPDGTLAAGIHHTSSVPVPEGSGRLAVRVFLDVVAGIQHGVNFYTAPTIDGTYVSLGPGQVSGSTTAVFTGSSVIEVGRALWDDAPQMFQGKVYAFEFRNGLNGVLAASADFTAMDAGVSEWDDAQANAWGLRGRAVMANPAARFHGEVSVWPQRWDKSGNDVYVPLQAYGILRRLGQGSAALRSTLYRGLTADESVVAYWPCEDGSDATSFGSALPGHPRMFHPNGDTDNAAFEGFRASEPLPHASGIYWSGAVPTYTVTGRTQVNFLMHVPAGGLSVDATVCRVRCSGSAPEWELDVNTTGSMRLRGFNDEYVVIEDSGYRLFDVNGRMVRVSIEFDDTGSGIDYTVAMLEVGQTVGFAFSDSLASRTFNRATNIGMNVREQTMDDVALGHISVHNEIKSIYSLADELNAYSGELATNRILRLCEDQGVPVSIVGDVNDATPLGPQLPGAFMDLVHEAADADMGILYEPREHLGLAYRTRASMYAQEAALTLDYGAGTVSGIEPTEDDDATRNDVTVQRVNGSSARASLTTGPLSVNAPPNGVGRYDDEATVSLERDVDLPNQASWRLHMGTVDEPRYPVIGVNLAGSAYTSDAALTADAQAFDVGDRLVVSGAPSATTSPEDIQQIGQGFTETITPFEWLIDVNCTPASPWDVAVWGDESGPGEARYSSDGTTTTQALTTTGTVIPIDTPTGPLWSAEDGPFDITVGGERMTVTDVVTNVEGASFETDEDWVESGTDVSVTQSVFASGVLDGAFCAAIDIDAAPTSTVNGVGLAAAVVAGEWLAARIPVRPGGTTPVEGGRVRIEWFNSVGASISATTGTRQALSAFQYGYLTYSAQAPANTASARVYLFLSSAGSDVPPANSTAHTDAWAVAAAASQAEALALVGSGYGQQFMAVTRSVNGVVKTHTSGADVALAKIAIYAL